MRRISTDHEYLIDGTVTIDADGIPVDIGPPEPTILLDTDGTPYFILGRTGIDIDVDGIPYVTIGA